VCGKAYDVVFMDILENEYRESRLKDLLAMA
jgi:hypothetical protein